MSEWPKGKFRAIYLDPPWTFVSWSPENQDRVAPYQLMSREELKALPVGDLADDDCTMFMWICWPQLEEALELFRCYGFTYKTCAFSWIKADSSQIEMFRDDLDVQIGLGYWTRANSEVCLLGTRGNPKRLNADVRQAIIEPRREHSRKPECVYDRIERLVDGPYVELFARNEPRPGWTKWGNDVGKFRTPAAPSDPGKPICWDLDTPPWE